MEKKSAPGWGKRLGGLLKTPRPAEEGPVESKVILTPLHFLPAQCVGCSACTLTCTAVVEGLAPSWFEPKLRFLGGDAIASPCETCGDCVAVCPFGVVLHPRSHAG